MNIIQPIQRIFTGKHVDLAKLVSVSDAYFIDRMGSGGFYVAFKMHFQLMDNPITYSRELTADEYQYHSEERIQGSRYTLTSTRREQIPVFSAKDKEILAVQRLQSQVDTVIRQWQEVRENY